MIGQIGQINAERFFDDLNLTFDAVDNAMDYEIYKSTDGVNYNLLSAQTELSFAEVVGYGNFYYKYRAKMINAFGVIEYSEYAIPAVIKRGYFHVMQLQSPRPRIWQGDDGRIVTDDAGNIQYRVN